MTATMEEADSLLGAMDDRAMSRGVRARASAYAGVACLGLFVVVALVGGFAGSDGFASGLGAAVAAARGSQAANPAPTPPAIDPLVTFNSQQCRETRAALAEVTNHDGDIVIIPELKAVYVDIVKAASESIRSALEEKFHASWTQDYGQFAHPVLGRPQRSTTSYLTSDFIANYTFFTFVRDPNTRFRSSYAQAICRERCTLCAVRGKEKMYTPTIPEITAFLQGRLMHFYRDLTLGRKRADEISLQEAWVDEHFESQILRLSGSTFEGKPVPINFIGRVENFEHDWARLMDHLGVKDEKRREAPGTIEHSCDIPARGKVVAQQRASRVTTQEKVAVASLYHDDFVCLGYHKPKV